MKKHAHEMVASLYLKDVISFDALAESVGRQDAETVRISKKLLGDGETFADELADG